MGCLATSEKTFDVAGRKIVCKAWTTRELLAFIEGFDSDDLTLSQLTKFIHTHAHKGLVSVDGVTGTEADNALDDLLPADQKAFVMERYTSCYMSAEDKKKSESLAA